MTPPPQTADDVQRPGSRAAMLGLLVILASLSMLGPFNIDTPFPAFGRIGSEFDVSTEQLQFLVTAYMVAFAVMSPFHGPISDAVGRKPVIVTGLVLYLFASIGCALAPSFELLLFFRVLQGLSAGGGVIVSRTVIRDLFDGARAQVLMSRVMMIFSIAPAIAPIIGGWLLYTGTWRAIFWFLVLLAAAMIAMVAFALPESHPVSARTAFSPGAIVGSLAEVSRSPRFHRVALSAALSFGGQFLYISAAPIFVIHLLGKGEQDFWMLFVPIIFGVSVGAFLSSHLAGRVTYHQQITAALAFSIFGALVGVLLAITYDNAWPACVIGPMLIAVGTGTAYPVQQLVLLDMFPASRGASVSMFTFLTLMLNGLGAALVAPYIAGTMLHLALGALGYITLATLLWASHILIGRQHQRDAVRSVV